MGRVLNDRKLMISMGGLLITMVVAVYFVVQLSGQAAATTGDFTAAGHCGKEGCASQVILRGQFEVADKEDGRCRAQGDAKAGGG